MSNPTKMAVCKLYQLARFEGTTFTKDQKKVLAERVVVERHYMERVNDQSEKCGKYYEEDVKASEDFDAEMKARSKAMKEADENEAAATHALTKMVGGIKKNAGKKGKDKDKEEEEQE